MTGRPTKGTIRAAAAATALALVVAGCAGAGPGTPGPAAPGGGAAPAAGPAPSALPRLVATPKPADLGVVERYAWQTVEQLADALARGETAVFLNKVSNGFYKGYARLDAAVNELVGASESRSVVVAVRDVTVDGERVSVRAQWTRSFRMRSGESSEAAGETTFLFLKGDTALRLLDYRGDAPFGIPGI